MEALTQAVLASHAGPTALNLSLLLFPWLLEISVWIQGDAGSRAWRKKGRKRE